MSDNDIRIENWMINLQQRKMDESSLSVDIPKQQFDPITGELRKPEDCESCSA